MTKINSILVKLCLRILFIIAPLLPDKFYLSVLYRLVMGYWMDFNNPKTFNEKLQWLKLYNRNPLYTTMVDKIEAKKYVERIIGEEHIIKTLAVYDNVDEIDFSKLPNQFVLKCSHDSGGIVLCTDKNQLDIEAAKKKLGKGLKHNYYYKNREWPYKNVKPRIICEEYIAPKNCCDLKDYKWFCFDGVPKFLFVASDRNNKDEETKFDFYDCDFKPLNIQNGHPNSSKENPKPLGFEEMKYLASKLSSIKNGRIPHVRVDFYDVNGKILFGELTFYHWSGLVPFNPPEWDIKLGQYINIEKSTI